MTELWHHTIALPDGFKVGVTEGGAGIPLVFLHGLGVSARAYTEMLELLAKHGFYVVALDAPDHGSSDSLPWGHTVKDMTGVIYRALDQLGMERFVLAGHSMGGAIVVEFASRFPQMVDTAILMNAAAGEEHHKGVAITPGPNMPIRAISFLVGSFRDVSGDLCRAGKGRSLGGAISLYCLLKRSVSGLSSLKSMVALMKHDTEVGLRAMNALGIHTVTVHGIEDGIVPVAAAKSAWRLAGGTILLMSGKFHSWMISEPELALNVIIRAVTRDCELVDG